MRFTFDRSHVENGDWTVNLKPALPLLLVVSIIVLCSPAAPTDYEAGRAAWQEGRPAEAITQWRAAAGTGDLRAMLALGRAYVKGLGCQSAFNIAPRSACKIDPI